MDKSKIRQALERIRGCQAEIDAEVQKVIIQLGGDGAGTEDPVGDNGRTVVANWFDKTEEIIIVDRIDMTRSRGIVKETQLPCVISEQDVRESDRKAYREILDRIRSDKCWERVAGRDG